MAFRRILATTDFTPGAKRAFRTALALARELGAELHVLHVAPQPRMRSVFFVTITGEAREQIWRRIERKARRKMQDFLRGEDLEGLRWVAAVRAGQPSEEIVRYAREEGVDVIVLGERPETRGQHILQHLAFESVGERVRRTAACPVLTVR